MVYPPGDGLRVDQRCVCHHLHPGLHIFGIVCAEVVRPHVWVCRLVGEGKVERGRREEPEREKHTRTQIQ